MITQTLVNLLIETNIDDLPEETILEAKRSLLNWSGVAIAASRHPSMEKVLKLAHLVESQEQATVLGREEKTDMLFAALLNGMSSHIYDFDDTLLETVLHPSAPVLPAILAYAEKFGKSGKEVLGAFVLGCEVEARLALALYPSHYWRGWHITGTVGTIGAACAVAKLQGLDQEQLSYAIGLAATEPTGLREMFGTMTKPFHPGKAAMNGLMAAFLAETGFTSSMSALEAKRGYGHVLSDAPQFSLLTKDWGTSWEILKNSYKPFASGIVTHPAIDGIIRLKKRVQLDPEEVESIQLLVHPLVQELTGKTSPVTGLEGKFSVYHCVAVGLLDEKASINQFSDERVQDEQVVRIRNRVHLEVSDEIAEDQAKITVTTKNGDVYEEFVEHAIGSKDVPMTTEQLKEKFKDVVGEHLSHDQKEELIQLIFHLDEEKDMKNYFKLCI